ncbi:CopD family protein [Halobacteriaceae archaeon GCM10025711]
MATIDSLMRVLHMLFAGVWVGGTLFMAGAVLPAARAGRLPGDSLEWILGRFSRVTMAAVVVMFVTGGHLAGQLYEVQGLLNRPSGHLVLTMTALWFVLAGLLHFGSRSLSDGLDDGTAEDAVEASRTWFLAAAGVGLVLLVLAGLL